MTRPLPARYHRVSPQLTTVLGAALLRTGSPLLVRGVVLREIPDTLHRGFLMGAEVREAITALLGAAPSLADDFGATALGQVAVELASLVLAVPDATAVDVWPEDVPVLAAV